MKWISNGSQWWNWRHDHHHRDLDNVWSWTSPRSHSSSQTLSTSSFLYSPPPSHSQIWIYHDDDIFWMGNNSMSQGLHHDMGLDHNTGWRHNMETFGHRRTDNRILAQDVAWSQKSVNNRKTAIKIFRIELKTISVLFDRRIIAGQKARVANQVLPEEQRARHNLQNRCQIIINLVILY